MIKRPRKPQFMREKTTNKTVRGLRVFHNLHLVEKLYLAARLKLSLTTTKKKRNRKGTWVCTLEAKQEEKTESLTRRGKNPHHAKALLLFEVWDNETLRDCVNEIKGYVAPPTYHAPTPRKNKFAPTKLHENHLVTT